MNEKVNRDISVTQEKLLRVLDCLRYATIQDISISDGQIRKMKVTISVDFNDPDSFRKTIEELTTIQL